VNLDLPALPIHVAPFDLPLFGNATAGKGEEPDQDSAFTRNPCAAGFHPLQELLELIRLGQL
jgi:hypothetical protein